ncbi:WD40 repeat domain-containing protein [Actinoallomurus sp. CA-150999]|uniref:WD40 repeat domain-containing protein n=1 Tax=Actinoallomurus sp. CA-150999 TaxID=3239887 RepID=UPI003D8A0DF4
MAVSTDLYGVRVLGVSPDRLGIRFRIFMVYYDVQSRTHPPVPDDPSFFFTLLWQGAAGYHGRPERGPLYDLVTAEQCGDGEWVDANTRRFVATVERLSSRNHPVSPSHWDRLHDFYYERDGHWKDEDLLVQFDYAVRVTDGRWTEPFRAGDAWGTASFPYNADIWTADDAPHLPDLARPAVTLAPFPAEAGDHDYVDDLKFSDDGRYLAAVADWSGTLWVYDTRDWSERARGDVGDIIVPRIMWVPGSHVVTVKSYGENPDEDDREQWAFDVDALTEVDVPFEEGRLRSSTGRYRVGCYDFAGVDFHETDRSPRGNLQLSGGSDPIQCLAFATDESRLFLGAQQNLYIVDPATRTEVDKVENASARLFELDSSPDGAYVAVASESRKQEYLRRPSRGLELCVWRTADKKIIQGAQLDGFVHALAWSPDGRRVAVAVNPFAEDGTIDHGSSSKIMVFSVGIAVG